MRERGEPARILQVINSSEEGGGARHLQALVSRLGPAGFHPVVATTDHGPLVSWLEAADVRVVDVDMMRSRLDPRPAVRLRRLMARQPFDLVHLHGTRAGFFGTVALSTLPGDPRVVYTIHGLSCSRKAPRSIKRFFARVERFIAWRADRVISVSDNDRVFGVERGILPSERTCSIPNGIALNGDGARRALPFAGGADPRVLTVARLVPQKGIPILLEAARKVADRRPEVTFTVFGDGPERAALEARVHQLALQGTVRFPGTVENVAERLLEFDLFVLPSLWEGMPISLLEAMAAARPAIATAISGSAELVIDGETGHLVPPGDPETLARTILSTLGDPEAAEVMGARARDRVRRNYSVDRMVESTVEIYRELLV